MFKKLFDKFNSFAGRHQALITLTIIFALICITWGIEHLIEMYFAQFEIYAYLGSIFLGLFLLWLTRHFMLHVL